MNNLNKLITTKNLLIKLVLVFYDFDCKIF